MKIWNRFLTFILSLIVFCSTTAYAWDSKKCGEILVVSDKTIEIPENYVVCRYDDRLKENGVYTHGSKTTIYVNEEINETIKSHKKIIDHVLLQELLPLLKEKLKPLEEVYSLPDNKETAKIKKEVTELKKELFNSKLSAKKQVARILHLYPDLTDKIYAQDNLRPLLCRYHTKEMRKQKWLKVLRISGKIVAAALVIGGLIGGGAGILGAIPLASVAGIIEGVGLANIGLNMAELGLQISSWGPVRAKKLADNLLEIDNAIAKELGKAQQQDPIDADLVLKLQSLRLPPNLRKELNDVKSKGKAHRRRTLGAGLRVILSSLISWGGSEVKDYVEGYDDVGNINYIDNTNGGEPDPVGGDDGG